MSLHYPPPKENADNERQKATHQAINTPKGHGGLSPCKQAELPNKAVQLALC